MGISQEELAERAMLHRTYISDVERGARNVSLLSIERLAQALGTSLPAIFSPDAALADSMDQMVDILYVEDEADEVMVAQQSFKHAKITNRIVVVRDGLAALEFLQCTGRFANRKPEGRALLVLLDLDLPRINGLEVLERIRKDARLRSTPVIALGTSEADCDTAVSKRLGADACILKPLDFQKLAQVTAQLNLHWALQPPPPKE